VKTLGYRLAKSDDVVEIVRIYNESIPGRLATADLLPVTVADRAAWFQGHSPDRRPIWVAELDGVVVGWLSFSDFYGRIAYNATSELSVYVDPAAQRMGVARFLLTEAVAVAPTLGIDTLLGFIFDHNEPSLRLFESFGFVSWGHLPRVAVLDADERGVKILGLRVGK
jgi:L-amino acid N-acyltransferase YncA